jgi:hypothetical protein
MEEDECVVMTKECATKFKAAAKERGEIKILLQTSIAGTQKVSDRLFKTNGKRALVEEIRDNREECKRIEVKLDDLSEAKPVAAPPPPPDKEATKFKYKDFEMTTNSVEVASAFVRVVALVCVLAGMYYGHTLLKDLKSQLESRAPVGVASE